MSNLAYVNFYLYCLGYYGKRIVFKDASEAV